MYNKQITKLLPDSSIFGKLTVLVT